MIKRSEHYSDNTSIISVNRNKLNCFAILMLFLCKIYRNNTVKKIPILFLFFVHFFYAKADDSLKVVNKPLPLKYWTVSQFEHRDSISYLYNTLKSQHNYLPRNTFGNSGLAFNDFIYNNPLPFGFNYSKNYYRNYYYTPYSINFYNTRIPYTDLLYVFGSQKEQFFKMAFSYNILKNWNFSANFTRVNCLGYYQRQRSDVTCFSISSNYRSRDNRYMLLISGALNSVKAEENGGMAKDSAFFAGRISYEPTLKEARTFRVNRNVFIRNYLNLGHQENDTMPVQTTSRFILTSVYDENALKFTDSNPRSKYYNHIYFDSTKTHDSVNIFKLENELAWKRVDNLKHRGILDMIGVGVGIKHQYMNIDYRQSKERQLDSTINNFLASAELNNLYSKNNLYWKFSILYGLKGYNREDYEGSGTITKVFRDSLSRISITAKAKAYAAPFMYNLYLSNNFSWLTNFEKPTEQTLEANLFLNKFDLNLLVNFTNYTNVLYFDTLAVPRQHKGTIPMLSVALTKNFEIFNWHLDNQVRYQQVPDSSVIRVPEFILQHALYYENDLFKKAMRLQIGVQVMYNTAYYANAYMPATGQFYIQNVRTYGNYPILDFFLNFKIKAVNAFFKIDHLNSNFSGYSYMLTPHYILNQRAFRLGVSWKFWN